MSRNPYSPPSAPVADPAAAPIVRPAGVTRAVQLLWASLALTFGATLLTNDMPAEAFEWGVTIALSLVYLAITSWLIVMIGRARNWARITYLVIALCTYLIVPFTWNEYLASLSNETLSTSIQLAATLLEIVALVLLFRRPSGAWFRARTQRDF